MTERLEKVLDAIDRANLTDEEKAELAGKVLDEIDPTGDNLAKFFDAMGDTNRSELACRASELPE